jgi:hypothetical protein
LLACGLGIGETSAGCFGRLWDACGSLTFCRLLLNADETFFQSIFIHPKTKDKKQDKIMDPSASPSSIHTMHQGVHPMVHQIPNMEYTDAPSVVESEDSSVASLTTEDNNINNNVHVHFHVNVSVPLLIRTVPQRKPLQWKFHGLTLWVEYEEFDNDLIKANYHFASMYGTQAIPTMHTTAIYGMQHLEVTEAQRRLAQIPSVLPNGKWPPMGPPVAVKQDISIEGRPGEVASISWAELTLKTDEDHEAALDAVSQLFQVERTGPWTPHLSLAYDNPEDSVLQLYDMVAYTMQHSSLLEKERRIQAISLWSTEGKMEDWKCLDRVHLE